MGHRDPPGYSNRSINCSMAWVEASLDTIPETMYEVMMEVITAAMIETRIGQMALSKNFWRR